MTYLEVLLCVVMRNCAHSFQQLPPPNPTAEDLAQQHKPQRSHQPDDRSNLKSEIHVFALCFPKTRAKWQAHLARQKHIPSRSPPHAPESRSERERQQQCSYV